MSAVAVTVPVAAMVIILSLHNGLQKYVQNMYSSFDSELQVTPADSGMADIDSAKIARIAAYGVVSKTLQSDVLVEWGDRQYVAAIKGVDSAYENVIPIKSRIDQGQWLLKHGDFDRAVVGAGVSYALGLSISIDEPMYISALLPTPPMLAMLPVPIYNTGEIRASGVFVLDQATDSKYIFAPLDFVERLTGNFGKFSTLEIKPNGDVKTEIEQILGSDYVVKTRFEQRSTIFKVVNSERWLIFALLMLVAVIACLSLAGCTLMMISEKKAQSSTLLALGLRRSTLRAVFIRLSMMIVAIGVGTGLLLGAGLSLAQQHLGIIKMAGDTFLMQAYPADVHILDLALVTIAVAGVGYIIVAIAARSSIK